MAPNPYDAPRAGLPFDPATEARYRLDHLRSDSRRAAWGAAFGALAYLAFIPVDRMLHGDSLAFAGLQVMRAAVVALAAYAAWTALTTRSVARYERVTAVYMLVYALAQAPLNLSRPSNYSLGLAADLILLVGLFVFLPDRPWTRLLPTGVLTAWSCAALAFYRTGIPPFGRASLATGFLVTYALGAYATAWLYRARREAWWREQSMRRLAERQEAFSAIKSRFLREISHRFRTPLNVLSTGAELLGTYGGKLDAAQREEVLERVRSSLQLLTGMLDELLLLDAAHATVPTPVAEPFSLGSWLGSLAGLLGQGPPGAPTVTATLEGPDRTLHCDRSLLGEALRLAVADARASAPPGAAIRLTAAPGPGSLELRVQYPTTDPVTTGAGPLASVFLRSDPERPWPRSSPLLRRAEEILTTLGGRMEAAAAAASRTLSFHLPLTEDHADPAADPAHRG